MKMQNGLAVLILFTFISSTTNAWEWVITNKADETVAGMYLAYNTCSGDSFKGRMEKHQSFIFKRGCLGKYLDVYGSGSNPTITRIPLESDINRNNNKQTGGCFYLTKNEDSWRLEQYPRANLSTSEFLTEQSGTGCQDADPKKMALSATGAEIEITNKTNKRIMPMVMYCGATGDDKKDWWPLVPEEEFNKTKQTLEKKSKELGILGVTAQIKLEDFNPEFYKGQKAPRILSNKMSFHDERGKDFFIGVGIFPDSNSKKDYTAVYTDAFDSMEFFEADFMEENGEYYFIRYFGSKDESGTRDTKKIPVKKQIGDCSPELHAHWMRITNQTNDRIMVMAMYPNKRSDDKKDWWPLVTKSELDTLKEQAKKANKFLTVNGQNIPAISLEDFNPITYKGKKDLRPLADSMAFYDSIEQDYIVGIGIFPSTQSGQIAEAYSNKIPRTKSFVADFKEQDGIYSFNDIPAKMKIDGEKDSHWMGIKNNTKNRIMVMAMYCGARGDDKKDAWPLVTSAELDNLKKNSKKTLKFNGKDMPAISLENFGRPDVGTLWKGNPTLRPLADSMAFYDQREKDYFVGIAIIPNNKSETYREVYTGRLAANENYIARFVEKDGKYSFERDLGNGKTQVEGAQAGAACD